MKTQIDTHRIPVSAISLVSAAVVVIAILLSGSNTYAGEKRWYSAKRAVVGNWYVALAAGPFNPNFAGLNLSGLAQFHSDLTFMLSDAGDFGAQSFATTVATPQYGAWSVTGRNKSLSQRRVIGTTLFLEADKATGEALGWTKVQFVIEVIDGNHLQGAANVFFLPCENTPPFPTPITCPDPIANAAAFMPASPPDVPVTFTRITSGQ